MTPDFRIVVAMLFLPLPAGFAAGIADGTDGFKAKVMPFFEANCIKCHGPEKSKGKVTLHTLDGDLAAGHELERWEKFSKCWRAARCLRRTRSNPVKPTARRW